MDQSEEKLLSRMQLTEKALELLETDELPHLKRLLFGARCEVREITNSKIFWASPAADSELRSHLDASRRVGIVRSSPDSASHFHVFVENQLDESQQALLARMFRSFMTVTYAALGLDMSIAQDDDH